MSSTRKEQEEAMIGKFVMARDTRPEVLAWGRLAWLSNPPKTGAEQLTVTEVTLAPGKGHNFHKHPAQEEVVYVVAGMIEQWIKREKHMLAHGDSCFIPANTVHASFNVGGLDAKLIAIHGPCVGPIGCELVEVSDEAPWKDIRKG
jgi:quercetin dioxygenase-like cupin family protein